MVASFLALIKQKYKLYNSIEEIYEAILQLGLIIFCIYPPASSPIFAIVLRTSISAGISKLRSPLWSLSGNGFLMFCTLPSISRRHVRTIASSLCKRNKIFKIIMSVVSLITPYVQIISVLLLLTFPVNLIIFLMALSLQLMVVFCYSFLLVYHGQ